MPRHDAGEDHSFSRRDVLNSVGALGATAVGTGLATGHTQPLGTTALYQYYHTDWTAIERDLPTIAAQGYDGVQLPPAQRSRLDRSHQRGVTDPPLGYQPVDFTDFDSVFGTARQYRSLVETAHEEGLAVVADAVVNHMAADDDFRGASGVSFEELPYFSELDFHPEGEIDYDDPDSVETDWLEGLKDLRQESAYVRRQLRDYVRRYAALGVDGIRWDAAKHVPAWFFEEFANPWAEDLELWTVGEVLHGDVDYCRTYAETGMSVTDYPLYYRMREDVFHPDGDMRALETAGLVDRAPFDALTFVSNHDSPPPAFERLAYAYVLTYEGYPRVYNGRVGIDDPEIRNLLWIRTEIAEGPARTRHVDRDSYVYEREGTLLVGLNRSDDWLDRPVRTSWTGRRLHDYSGHAEDVTTDGDGEVTISIPPRGWVCFAPADQ